MKTTSQEKKNSRKGWFFATVSVCLFLISASFVSCWEKPVPLEMPGEVMVAFGDTDFGSGEPASASASPSSSAPQITEEATEANNPETPSTPVTDIDSDAIPEEIKKTEDPDQNQTNQNPTDQKEKDQAEKDRIAKVEADRIAKEERDAKLKADQEAQAEKDRLAKIEADRIAQEERDAAALGGGGDSDQSGQQGKPDGKDISGNGGGNTKVKGTGNGAPSGWRLVNEPGNLHVSQRAKVTIKYKINHSGKVLSVTDVIAPTLTSSDIENIKREIRKLEFKPINEADIKPGATYSGTYTWELNY